MTHIILAIIYLAFISLGLPDSMLGAAWPDMYAAFGVPLSYAGIYSSHNNLCFSLVNSLFLTFSFIHRDIF